MNGVAPAARLQGFARNAGIAIIALALGAYALAALVWSQDQPASALILAIFGYAVVRSRRAMTTSLTARRFGSRPEYAAALAEHLRAAQGRADRHAAPAEENRKRKAT